MTFNNLATYDTRNRYGLAIGTYSIAVPAGYAIALLNIGKTNITYTGDNNEVTNTLIGTTADGEYIFYSGNVTVNVTVNVKCDHKYKCKCNRNYDRKLIQSLTRILGPGSS